MNLEVILPLKEDVVACIENFFSANKAPRTDASSFSVPPGMGRVRISS
jgi:hypothetical protein